ncbi:MAG: hypothetical protein WC717_01165 [Candidatus Micrarchaeia archaeon]
MEKSNVVQAAEIGERIKPIVNVVSQARTTNEMIFNMKQIGCKDIVVEPPGFSKKPDRIDFRYNSQGKDYYYQVNLGSDKTTIIENGKQVKEVANPAAKQQSQELGDLGASVEASGAKPGIRQALGEGIYTSIQNNNKSETIFDCKETESKAILEYNAKKDKIEYYEEKDGKRQEMTRDQFQTLLNENGYNINVAEFEKLIREQLQKLLGITGSSFKSGDTEPSVAVMQQITLDQYFNKLAEYVQEREKKAVGKDD